MNLKRTLSTMFLALSLMVTGCSSTTGGSDSKPAPTENKPNEAPQEQAKTNFPEKPITLVVGFEPGGSNDTTARIIAGAVKKYLPNQQEVVVVNKPGGGSTIALTEVFNSKPDGYTLAIATNTALTIAPHTTKLAYEWNGFSNIMRLVSIPQVLAVKKDAPWNTFEEWLEYVKANPGKFQYSDSGTGTIAHLGMEELNYKAGIQTTHVPYKGAGPAMQALLGGHVQGTASFAGNADPTQTKILVSFAAERSKLFDVPVISEKGIDAGITSWIGLVTAPGLPQDIQQVLHDAFKKALEDPEVAKQLEKQGLEPFYANSEEFAKVIDDSYQKYGEIMKNIGMVK